MRNPSSSSLFHLAICLAGLALSGCTYTQRNEILDQLDRDAVAMQHWPNTSFHTDLGYFTARKEIQAHYLATHLQKRMEEAQTQGEEEENAKADSPRQAFERHKRAVLKEVFAGRLPLAEGLAQLQPDIDRLETADKERMYETMAAAMVAEKVRQTYHPDLDPPAVAFAKQRQRLGEQQKNYPKTFWDSLFFDKGLLRTWDPLILPTNPEKMSMKQLRQSEAVLGDGYRSTLDPDQQRALIAFSNKVRQAIDRRSLGASYRRGMNPELW